MEGTMTGCRSAVVTGAAAAATLGLDDSLDTRADRPERACPTLGLIVEVDSQEFHDGRFEQDHQRQTTYDLLGFEWTTVTPNQLRDSPLRVRRAIERRLEGPKRNPQSYQLSQIRQN
jgi:hypothetical protein